MCHTCARQQGHAGPYIGRPGWTLGDGRAVESRAGEREDGSVCALRCLKGEEIQSTIDAKFECHKLFRHFSDKW